MPLAETDRGVWMKPYTPLNDAKGHTWRSRGWGVRG